MSKRKWTDEQFIDAVKESFSYAQVIEKLNLKVAGSNYDTVKMILCPNCHSFTDNYRGKNIGMSAQEETLV